jgi:hypothetical protein
MPILKLKRHNSRKEIEFELEFLKSLPLKERFRLMLKKSREMLDLLEKNGHRRPSEIVKRA